MCANFFFFCFSVTQNCCSRMRWKPVLAQFLGGPLLPHLLQTPEIRKLLFVPPIRILLLQISFSVPAIRILLPQISSSVPAICKLCLRNLLLCRKLQEILLPFPFTSFFLFAEIVSFCNVKSKMSSTTTQSLKGFSKRAKCNNVDISNGGYLVLM